MAMAKPIWWTFDLHLANRAAPFARVSAGNSIAARTAMIAITTSSSTRVKACEESPRSLNEAHPLWTLA